MSTYPPEQQRAMDLWEDLSVHCPLQRTFLAVEPDRPYAILHNCHHPACPIPPRLTADEAQEWLDQRPIN